MSIFAISDLHADNRENRELVDQINPLNFQDDSLIIAGDISNKLSVIESTLTSLASKFKHLFFVPGNHELWVAKDHEDSFQKFDQILALCDRLGIHTQPKLVDGAWVVPLFSWYEAGFYPAGDPNAAELQGWSDFHLCNWGDEQAPLDLFLQKNRPNLHTYDRPVISFSHFVPRLELIPSPNVLFFKSLPLVAGSTKIDDQLRQIGSQVHVFGHTHINRDLQIDQVRYVQNALRYPRERKMFNRANVLNLVNVWPT